MLLVSRSVCLLVCVWMCACASGDAGPAPDPIGGGDIDSERTTPSGTQAFGEGFSSPDAATQALLDKQRREARDARWKKHATSLKKDTAERLWARAEADEKAQNWKDAQDAALALVVFHDTDARAADAAHLAMRMAFRRGEYGEGFTIFEDALPAFVDPLVRARQLRQWALTLLAVPHWGTTRGGDYLRGRYEQGKQTQTYREDRAKAVALLEEARDLMQKNAAPRQERALLGMELALAVARFTDLDATWHYWWTASGADDGLVEEEGEDERADEGRYSNWSAELMRARPRGIASSPGGEPIFVAKPQAYAPGLADVAKLKFLLDEVQLLDDSVGQKIAAQALLTQALLFRNRDGAERLDRLRGWWWRGSAPYQDAGKDVQLSSLGENEVLTLVATSIRRIQVPPDECVPCLLKQVGERYPRAEAADEARYLLGAYYATRQQYPKALATWNALSLKKDSPFSSQAEVGANGLKALELALETTAAQPAGVEAKLKVQSRNLDEAFFEATRIDSDRILADFEKAWANGPRRQIRDWQEQELDADGFGYRFMNPEDKKARKYLTSEKLSFTGKLARDPEMRQSAGSVTMPIKSAGAWLVEGRTQKDGPVVTRAIVVVEKGAVVLKNTAKGQIAWVVNATDGTPLGNARVEVFTYGSSWSTNREVRHSKKQVVTTAANGTVLLPRGTESALVTPIVDGRRIIPVQHWLGYGYAASSGYENENVAVLMTDRTVYRPGDVAKVAVWARTKEGGVYKPASDVKRFTVRVWDARGQQVLTHEAAASRFGSTSFEVVLKKGAPLGAWRVDVEADGRSTSLDNNTFQVEEYKAPEVLVTVKAAGTARLGDKIPLEIAADYYAGGGVAGAKVTYKVYRRDHDEPYAAASPWDWLYGRGFGRVWYRYSWFSWWAECGVRPIAWVPWWGPPPAHPKELLQEGEARLDAQGRLKVSVDTAGIKKSFADRDHELVIEAEVVDLSRRLVRGEGSVVVTRTAYLAALEIDAGWTRAGSDVELVLSTLLPDGSPFAATGKLVFSEVKGVGEDGTVHGETIIEEQDVKTDTAGPLRVRWRAPRTGQVRITYVGKDSVGAEVKSSVLAWVVGPDFVGQRYRFAGVEVIADKRTYKVGDVARFLVNADRAGASVLFASKVDGGTLVDWQILSLPNKSTIVEVPVTKGHEPNFFVEAVTVANAQVYEEAREVFVPPAAADLRVKLTPQKGELKPGETTEILVETTDGEGKPIAAQLALSVFDSAVLAIKPDAQGDPKKHLWGRKRWHQPSTTSNLGRPQAASGGLYGPDQQARWMLQSASQRWFQGEVDFVSGGNDKLGLAANAMGVATTDAKSPAAAPPPPQGKLARRIVAAEGEREESKAERDDAPAQSLGMSGVGPGGGGKLKEAKDSGDTRATTGSEGGFTPAVRKAFADTAAWIPDVVTDASGKARVKVTFPDNLTTWKVKALGMDAGARAGRGDSSMVTTKKLLVRLAAPRFFRERDEVVLSAIVQNQHKQKKSVDVSIDVSEATLVVSGSRSMKLDVPANSEARVDFKVKVRGEGEARVRVTARASDDGDAKELLFPVLVHGMEKTVARVGSIKAGSGTAEKTMEVEIPNSRRPEQTKLVVRTSPTLAGAMIDALPYLLDYPYGCVEQTLSRFVPAVLTRRALQQAGGIKLEDLQKQRTNLNPQQLTPGGKVDAKRVEQEARRFARNPIYDSGVLDEIVVDGLTRIRKMQHGDGGWGWWADDQSSAYMTAHVLDSLLDAKGSDLDVGDDMIQRGRVALRHLVERDIWRYRGEDREWVSDSDAWVLYVMSRFKDRHDDLQKLVFERRVKLSPYGKLLLAMTLHNLGDAPNANAVLKNVEQFRKADPENETSFIETSTTAWWRWWNDDIETNALYVRALDTIRPKDDVTPQVVKWLLNHRKHGFYWDSTRDTARVIAAFANHMQVSGERKADYDLEILWDGVVKKKVHVDGRTMFTVAQDLVLEGAVLDGGKHTITVRRTGQGAVYMNAYLSFFTTEDNIKAEGLEVKIDRKYFKLERADRTHEVSGDRGQGVDVKEAAYRKVPLDSGARLQSGDLVLVELKLTSKNDYDHLAFEDYKPAGLEAVALRSGAVQGETVAHMELRDERVVFFLSELTQGNLLLSYRLRAEVPGSFSAMPAVGFGMYAPEIRANSDEWKVSVVEAP